MAVMNTPSTSETNPIPVACRMVLMSFVALAMRSPVVFFLKKPPDIIRMCEKSLSLISASMRLLAMVIEIERQKKRRPK
jgi:hypothetical protein